MTTADRSNLEPLHAARRPFVAPTLTELPPLVALTLQTGAPVGGRGGRGGVGFSLARLLTGGLE